jgi:FkbM family methyltransferase
MRGLGLEVRRTRGEPVDPLMRLLRKFGVTVVLDVGANVGQFGGSLRRMGYTGRIVSFEPLRSVYEKLAEQSHGDSGWTAHNFALGDLDGEAIINRSAETQPSSFAEQTPVAAEVFDQAKVVGRETVSVRRLDSIFGDVVAKSDVTLLKIDTQGFEKQVLDGAIASLPSIRGVHVELSYFPFYAHQPQANEMIARLCDGGFRLVKLDPLFFDGEGARVIEADGTFFRF